ncbi:MAG: sensor histidine kinase [Eisenbergiella sp.]
MTIVETEKMQITVKDNGIGFKQEILEKLERNESIEKGGEHIGIQNVKGRIACFGETADMRIEIA